MLGRESTVYAQHDQCDGHLPLFNSLHQFFNGLHQLKPYVYPLKGESTVHLNNLNSPSVFTHFSGLERHFQNQPWLCPKQAPVTRGGTSSKDSFVQLASQLSHTCFRAAPPPNTHTHTQAHTHTPPLTGNTLAH